LEDVARDRNSMAPELKFLQEKSGPMYRSYRARVGQLREGLEDAVKADIKTEVKEEVKVDPGKKRKSRWGAPEDNSAQTSPGVILSTQLPGPGVALPTQLGGLVVPKPGTGLRQERSPGVTAYAKRVFGSTDLTEAQWKQCEDQLKMNAVYAGLAAKQALTNAKKASGQVKFDYDSDEDTEGGTWEHKARKAEMEKTSAEATALADEAEGGHHIGDFLPPEELAKFMEKCKAMKSGSGWDTSEYQENKLTQNNVGFKMLQKMGWSEGAGLGSSLQGITAPVGKSGQGAERQGLGADTGELNGNEDEFDTYRKRMMLAYRFRPNPMNNPRRSYY